MKIGDILYCKDSLIVDNKIRIEYGSIYTIIEINNSGYCNVYVLKSNINDDIKRIINIHRYFELIQKRRKRLIEEIS